MINFGNDWDEILKNEFKKTYYLKLREKLKEEYFKKTIFPPAEKIFNALKFVSFKDCKIVILGQDPYHGENQADGLAFSVSSNSKIPPSLLNIFTEIKRDLKKNELPSNGNLTRWAKQKVLLLNSTLTVRAHEPNSHSNIGWQQLTDEIIKILNKRTKPIVFILWGAFAKKKQTLISNSIHLILTAPHPSPLSAHRGFFGCSHFSLANSFLIKTKQSPINW